MKKIIIIAIALLFPLGVFAKDNWELKEKKNTLVVAGECSGREVKVDLFQDGNRDPIYSSGVLCQNGKFSFTDNLLQWSTLKDGEYTLVVNGDKQKTQKVVIERSMKKAETPKRSNIETQPTVEVPTDPEVGLLSSFVVLQQSILDMRDWLAQTKYPQVVKSSLGLALDGVDLAVSKVSELMASAQGDQPETVAAENENSTQIEEATIVEEAAAPIAIEPVVMEEVKNQENSVLDNIGVPDASEEEGAVTIDTTDGALTVDSNESVAQ